MTEQQFQLITNFLAGEATLSEEKLFRNLLQNNEEFKKFFPTCEHGPIIRDAETNRDWLNESLIIIKVGKKKTNLANGPYALSFAVILFRPAVGGNL